ncbi:MAG: MBL fold metallo-hydrolase [Archaeoglobaceae archaeon]
MDVEILELEIPFKNPSSVYVYLLDSRVLVDAGFCSTSNVEKIAELEPELCVITHHHIDHVGYAFFSDIPFYLSKTEAELIKIYENPKTFLDWQREVCRRYGIPESYLKPLEILQMLNLKLKGKIKYAEKLECLEFIVIPGHSPGHLCILKDNALFSGDAILSETTPNLSFYQHFPAGLEDYISSLERLKNLEIEVIYPAHEKRIYDPIDRIEALIDHYKQRLIEVVEILEKPSSVEEIARNIKWTVKYEKLDPFNKYLANLETLAYLRYLKNRGIVKEIFEGIVKFAIASKEA